MNRENDLPSLGAREKLWVEFLNSHEIRHVAEVGVWRGEFAATILRHCPRITSYTFVDPWQHLPHWNKPFNVTDQEFKQIYDAAIRNTDFAASKRTVIKATTLVARNSIEDGSLDFVYIDGDHTLRGIVIDALSLWPKIKAGGYLGGDDFVDDVWQHGPSAEPTFVKPFISYFTETVGSRLTSLPHNQFLIEKTEASLRDLNAGNTPEVFDLLAALQKRPSASNMLQVPSRTLLRRMANRAKTSLRSSLRAVSPLYREKCNVAAIQTGFPQEYLRTGVVFIHVPKAAGTSISMGVYGRSTGHISLEHLVRTYPFSMRRLRSCAVFRDPEERFVSAFRFLKKGGMNATDLAFANTHLAAYRTATECAEALIDICAQKAILPYMHFRTQTSWIVALKENRFVDCLVPFHRLDLLQDWLRAQLGRPIAFPSFNTAPTTASKEDSLSERARDVLKLLYADDFRLWMRLREEPTGMIAEESSQPGRNPRLKNAVTT
jgi:hypothetical protein